MAAKLYINGIDLTSASHYNPISDQAAYLHRSGFYYGGTKRIYNLGDTESTANYNLIVAQYASYIGTTTFKDVNIANSTPLPIYSDTSNRFHMINPNKIVRPILRQIWRSGTDISFSGYKVNSLAGGQSAVIVLQAGGGGGGGSSPWALGNYNAGGGGGASGGYLFVLTENLNILKGTVGNGGTGGYKSDVDPGGYGDTGGNTILKLISNSTAVATVHGGGGGTTGVKTTSNPSLNLGGAPGNSASYNTSYVEWLASGNGITGGPSNNPGYGSGISPTAVTGSFFGASKWQLSKDDFQKIPIINDYAITKAVSSSGGQIAGSDTRNTFARAGGGGASIWRDWLTISNSYTGGSIVSDANDYSDYRYNRDGASLCYRPGSGGGGGGASCWGDRNSTGRQDGGFGGSGLIAIYY